MTIRIFERWEMATPVAKHNEWFADWALRKPNEVSRHLTMGYHALQTIKHLEIESVHESFGGLGAQALMAEDLWPTAQHTVRDFSHSAFKYMVENLPMRRGLILLEGSSYDPNGFVTADLQIADVGDLTAARMNLEPYKPWLDHTFGSGAKAVVLTDIAGRLLHLHRGTYAKALGVERITDYTSYLFALGEMVRRRYGYFPSKTYYHHWSSITVFHRGDPELSMHSLIPSPSTPKGFEIL